MASEPARERSSSPGTAILCGGALVGLFDFAYATILAWSAGRPWHRPWQGVASALLGRDAFSAGDAAIALGLVCHFVVAFSIVTAYVLASRRAPLLARRAVPLGMTYGALVFFVMNWVVVPLTRIGRVPAFTRSSLATSLLVHVFLVGLPAALVARRAARPPAA
jgi:hypothetical protein